jgi:hypothetical protein
MSVDVKICQVYSIVPLSIIMYHHHSSSRFMIHIVHQQSSVVIWYHWWSDIIWYHQISSEYFIPYSANSWTLSFFPGSVEYVRWKFWSWAGHWGNCCTQPEPGTWSAAQYMTRDRMTGVGMIEKNKHMETWNRKIPLNCFTLTMNYWTF